MKNKLMHSRSVKSQILKKKYFSNYIWFITVPQDIFGYIKFECLSLFNYVLTYEN